MRSIDIARISDYYINHTVPRHTEAGRRRHDSDRRNKTKHNTTKKNEKHNETTNNRGGEGEEGEQGGAGSDFARILLSRPGDRPLLSAAVAPLVSTLANQVALPEDR